MGLVSLAKLENKIETISISKVLKYTNIPKVIKSVENIAIVY